MGLENYRELESGGNDLDAGFQWEFHCSECNRHWKSPFKPYRMGQLSGFLHRVGTLVMGRSSESMAHSLSDVGYRSAREKALAEALALAAERYVECAACHKGVCLDCIDDERHVCLSCAGRQRFEAAAGGNEASRAAAATCPSCHHPHPGGRFCPECGFDMASTHKTCPGCGAMAARQARFCVDCGHAF